MINDDLPIKLINGSITLKHGVKRLTETGVEFDDGTFEDNIDVVIYATGYLFKFPFIDKDIFKVTVWHICLDSVVGIPINLFLLYSK